MIRRHITPPTFHLITQDDHARLAGRLARHVGNARFSKPSERLITATTHHDAGWPLHDDAPTLNDDQLPRDVFESNRHIALPVWTASADRAQSLDPYVGLLVSLHGLALSVYATSHAPAKHERLDTNQLQDKFAVNQFQHREVERQESLRRRLDLRTDLPLTFGLAKPNLDPREDQLRYDFRLLQALDTFSLAICCTQPPAPTTQDVHPRPGADPLKFSLNRVSPTLLHVDPWPFDEPFIDLEVRARCLEARPYASAEAFHAACRDAPLDTLALRIAQSP